MADARVSWLTDRPRPWHLVLAPAVPLLGYVRGNSSTTDATAAIWTYLVVVFAAILSDLCVARLSGRPRASALAVTIAGMAFLSRATITNVGSHVPVPHAAALLFAMVVIVAAAILAFTRDPKALTSLATVTLAILIMLLGWPVAKAQARIWAADVPSQSPLASPNPTSPHPDVYVLILDAYGRQDTIRQAFGFDNTLVGALRSRGFFVAERAASNYQRTGESISSALNVDYLPALLGRAIRPDDQLRVQLAKLLADNRTFASFRSAGYEVRTFASEFNVIRPGRADERFAPFPALTDFEYGFYEGTMGPQILNWLGRRGSWLPLELHRRHIRYTFDTLERLGSDTNSRPTFTLAHVLMPHPPFAFNADGSARDTALSSMLVDDAFWQKAATGTNESYEAGYVDALKYVNDRVLRVVDRVLQRSGRPSIIYIQGDHGPRVGFYPSEGNMSSVRERMAILMAARFPDGVAWPIHAASTPVNAFRVVTNRALGTELPALPDRSYFGNYAKRPLVLQDVSDLVH